MNYSYDEINKMENAAMERVRRMQEHERELARQMNRDLSFSPEQKSKGQPQKKAVREEHRDNIPHTKHTRMPVEFSGRKNSFLPSLPFAKDNDSWLIISLLLLLQQEHADNLLLLALVYILM